MENIKKIYNRLTDTMVKGRVLPIYLSVQNVIFALIVLIYCNIIIANVKISGEINYFQVRFLYNIVTISLLIIVFVFAPKFLAGSLNSLYKNNTIEYLLSSGVKLSEIVSACFVRGFYNSVIMLVSAFPIACISLYFGGVGIKRVILLIFFLIFFTLFLSSFSLYISSKVREINTAYLIAYILCFILFVVHLFLLKYIIQNAYFLIIYVLIVLILTFIFIFNALKITAKNL